MSGCAWTQAPTQPISSIIRHLETDIPGLEALGDSAGIEITRNDIYFDYERYMGSAGYTLFNGAGEPLSAALAFPYTGGLYPPDRFHVTFDGAAIPFNAAFGRLGGEIAVDDYMPLRFDDQAEYTLYTINVARGQGSLSLAEHVYIGADFTVDSSRSRIVADGFGYAANPYGAVRIWSLSDGFDTGMGRHLYIIGDDIDFDVGAYEDAELTVRSDAVEIIITRQELRTRDYLLMFSAPMALSGKTGSPGDRDDDRDDDREELAHVYADALYNAYAEALDSLLEIHYFIPRIELYALAEERRNSAIIFDVILPAGTGGALEILFPLW
ncbi:MAG: hypothetical protein FWH01_03170 [Oscillospiraceae bacterium]|nr:hypothetical protein [Oscillospiraceae bacterium]